MFKMQIQMDEEKILRENVINLQKVYAALDEIFAKNGLSKEGVAEDGTITYFTKDNLNGFGKLCCISIILDSQTWFVPNCKKYLWIDNVDKSGKWETEDMLINALARRA